jgi:hypothetical protein
MHWSAIETKFNADTMQHSIRAPYAPQPVRKGPLAGYTVVQYCPVCRAYQQTVSVGLKSENVRLRVALPPQWPARQYEEFACSRNHTFRSYTESPAPARQPAPGT